MNQRFNNKKKFKYQLPFQNLYQSTRDRADIPVASTPLQFPVVPAVTSLYHATSIPGCAESPPDPPPNHLPLPHLQQMERCVLITKRQYILFSLSLLFSNQFLASRLGIF